jgi:hypothetical protein
MVGADFSRIDGDSLGIFYGKYSDLEISDVESFEDD